MSSFRFSPALALAAAGSIAGSANATVQVFSTPLQFDGIGPGTEVFIGGNATAQYTLGTTIASIKDPSIVYAVRPGIGNNTMGDSFITSATLPTSAADVTSTKTKAADLTGDNYLQLAFDIGGTKQLGVAKFTDAELVSVEYNAAGAVPEPAVWMELIVGFGVAGSALRVARRRRQPVAIAA